MAKVKPSREWKLGVLARHREFLTRGLGRMKGRSRAVRDLRELAGQNLADLDVWIAQLRGGSSARPSREELSWRSDCLLGEILDREDWLEGREILGGAWRMEGGRKPDRAGRAKVRREIEMLKRWRRGLRGREG